jgi:hypothetical protein
MLRAPVVIGASALVLVVGAPDRPSGHALQEHLERAFAMPTRMPTVAAEPARMVGLLQIGAFAFSSDRPFGRIAASIGDEARRRAAAVDRDPREVRTIFNFPGHLSDRPLAATRDPVGRWIGGSVDQWIEELTGAVLEAVTRMHKARTLRSSFPTWIGCCPWRPAARRVWRREGSLRVGPGPQELRRDQPYHPGIG